MTFWRLIRRSLAHYWRSNAAVVFGVAVAVAVLVGSLMVGDSVRGSLRELASERLGRVDYALAAPSFFTEELGNRLLRQDRAAERCHLAVPAIVLQGSVERAASDSMPAQVSVIGVRDDFWKLGRVNREISLEGRQVALNRYLADDLGAAEDDAVLLVGHPAEGTPARRLQDAAAEGEGAPVMLADGHGPQPVYCTVERFRFSGHSDRRELLSLVERMNPETVLLIHGDPDAKDWMAEHIKEAHPETEVHRPDWGSVLEV